MIDFAVIDDDLEKTQRLPLLTADIQLDEVLQRERAARIEIVELMRQNLQQREDLERLRRSQHDALSSRAQQLASAFDADAHTEQTLFEVCGALKDTLWTMLNECQQRGVALPCGEAAGRTLDDCCTRLDQILSAPGFCASTGLLADAIYACNSVAMTRADVPRIALRAS